MNSSARQTTDSNDITINDLLTLPEEKRRVLNWMQTRTACSFGAIVTYLQQSEDTVRSLLEELQQQGFVKPIAIGNETQYQVHLTSMRRRRHQKDGSSVFDILIDDD